MTRLLAPSPGEVLDRISILGLKIQAFEKKGKDSSNFVAEKLSLDEYLDVWKHSLKEDLCVLPESEREKIWDRINEKTNGLVAVNSLLWDSEDQVRSTSELQLLKLGALCLRIAKLNDSRADLVRDLNRLYNAEDHQEKIFGTQIGRSLAI